jgi:hypothetical protein
MRSLVHTHTHSPTTTDALANQASKFRCSTVMPSSMQYLQWLWENPRPHGKAPESVHVEWRHREQTFLGPSLTSNAMEEELQRYLRGLSITYILECPPPSLDEWTDQQMEMDCDDDLYTSSHPEAVSFREWAHPVVGIAPADLSADVDFGYAFLLELIDHLAASSHRALATRNVSSPLDAPLQSCPVAA